MIEIKRDELTVEQFLRLVESVGWSHRPKKQLEMALKHSLGTVVILKDNQAIAMGRMIGDCGFAYFIRDVVVHPDYQGNGYGRTIIEELLNVVDSYTPIGGQACVELMSSMGKESFYEGLGFKILQSINGASGMQLILEK